MTTHATKRTAASNGHPVGRSSASRGRDLPRPPRRYSQWAATVLFLLVAMLAAGWLWQQKSDRVEVLVVRTPVVAGEVLERGDLGTSEVAGVADAVPVGAAETVVGKTAVVGLVPGQLLTPGMVTSTPVPAPGERVVGVELDATRVPSGMPPGATVTVLAVPPSGDPSSASALTSPDVLAERALVQSATQVDGGNTRLTLVVPRSEANRVAAFGAAGRVAVVQTPLGGD